MQVHLNVCEACLHHHFIKQKVFIHYSDVRAKLKLTERKMFVTCPILSLSTTQGFHRHHNDRANVNGVIWYLRRNQCDSPCPILRVVLMTIPGCTITVCHRGDIAPTVNLNPGSRRQVLIWSPAPEVSWFIGYHLLQSILCNTDGIHQNKVSHYVLADTQVKARGAICDW